MQNSGNNKNTKRKGTMRYNHYGWAARGLAVMMAVIFSLTSLGAALPVSAESGMASDAAGADSSTSSVTPTPEATATPTPTPTEEAQKPYSDSTEVKESDGTLKVTAKADAGILPEGATLKVKPITKGDQDTSATYQQVEEKVKKDVAEDNRELTGFLAYDISFEKDGQEIEPDGKVNVTMNWTAAAKPEGTTETEQKDSDVSVLHLEKQNDSDSIADTKVVNLTENKEKGQDADNQATVEVKDGSKAVEKAEMTVSGFSVFTITWTTNGGNPTANIGNVSMHYVNEDGLEIDRTASLTDGSLSKVDGDVVKISEWVNNDSVTNERKVSGYKYVKATVGSVNGTEITGLKVQSSIEGGKTVYKLYYTSASDPDSNDAQWTEYKDSVSKNSGNNADIYLVLHSTAQSVDVHFVDEDGNIIINPIYHYANETFEKVTDHTFNIKQSGKTNNPWYEPIQNYEFTGRVHMGETGWQGFAFSRVRATVDDSGNYRYQYSLADSGENWTDLTATDVYLIYKKTEASIKNPVTIKYIHSDGSQMTDEAGNTLDRTVDASEWTSGQWQNIQGYSESVNGYTINQDAIFETQNHSDSDYSSITLVEGNGGFFANDTTKINITGNRFRYLRYVKNASGEGGTFQAGQGYQINTAGNVGASTFSGNKTDKIAPDSKINRYWTVNGNFTIYLIYDADKDGKTYSYTIHYVDEQGNKIAPDSDKKTFQDTTYAVTEYTIGVGTGYNYDLSTGVNPSGYAVTTQALLGRPTVEQGGLAFTSVKYTRDGQSSSWKYQINGEGDAKELNLTNLDFYVVYEKTPIDTGRKVTIHFVDTSGNNIASSGGKTTWETRTELNKTDSAYSTWKGDKYTDTSDFGGSSGFINSISKDYTFVGEYLGPDFNMDENKLVTTTAPSNNNQAKYVQWLYHDNKWFISHGDSSNTNHSIDGSDSTVFEGYITDIYWVYAKTNLTVHYVKLNADNTISTLDNPKSTTISSLGSKDKPTSLSNETYAPIIDGLAYIGTRLGPSSVSNVSDLGPDARNVYLDNGKRIYYFDNPTPYPMTKQGNNDMWLYAAPTGRRFTLRKTTGTSGTNEAYTIEDSQHGTLAMNLSTDGTYTATFHGETETTEYTVIKSTKDGKDTYSLNVHNYLTSDLNDIYEIYRDDAANEAAITIDNDLQYSGYLVSDLNTWFKTRMADDYKENDKITDYYYSWNKITTGDGYEGEKNTEVVRAQNGPHWNIAYNRKERTSLDVEADNGGRNDTDQKTVNYTVTFHYKIGDGDWQTVTSPRCTIDYYSQLMNGDFETPSKTVDDQKPDGTSGGVGFYTNQHYKDLDGVWQTTAGDNYIEIVNTTSDKGSSYDWNDSLPFTAAHGNQFAELNANRAGALYQDVVTHPNTYLNYWFSHRARGKWPNPGGTSDQDKKAIPEYDTMYLVIMPTKLAMTAADGGELKTQTQLSNFISAHGGFDTDKATAVGQQITYRNDTDGILIEKVSSNDQFWHNVNVPNGYIAKGGLTRFFFVAGPQAYDESAGAENTHGNFIDNVGFDQILPPPQGFHLTVTKTFSGLSTAQIASLVSGDSKFKITLSDHYSDSKNNNKNGTDESSTPPNSTLNGAVLSFTVNNNGSAIPFTATAVDSNNANLLTGSNSGNVIQNDDGSITMTWTFQNQAIDSDKTGESFNYFADESNATVSDFTLNADKRISTKDTDNQGNIRTGGENTNQPGSAIIQQGTDATFTMNNTYRSYQESDQPRIVVSKTFYGLTPSGVDEMFADGYQMTVTKQATAGQQSSSEILSTNDAALDSNVTYTTSQDDNHNTTVRWVISGDNWKDGTYNVTERNYSTSDYKVTQVKVNDGKVDLLDDRTQDLTKEEISVGFAANGVTLSSQDGDVKEANAAEGESLSPVTDIPKDTNFVAVQYTVRESTNYLVWTATSIGRNVSAAILKKINASTNDGGTGWTDDTEATFSNTIFRSGEAGAIATSGGSINFDHAAGTMTFSSNKDSQLQWKKFYSTKISGEDQADIRVVNRYNPVVRIQKVDAGDVTKTLSGAEFRLFKIAGSGTPAPRQYYDADATGNTNPWTTSEENADSFQTTGDEGSVKLPELPAGTYFLEETKAPDGYNTGAKPIAFTISSNDSVVQAVTTDDGKIDGIAVEAPIPAWNHPYYTITVENTAGTVLPNTGGSGTWSFMLSGLAMIFLAGGWLWLRNYRKQASLSDGI